MILPNHETKDGYMIYLEKQLIPDLKEQGFTAIAEDFEEALHWLRKDIQFKRMIADLRLNLKGTVTGRFYAKGKSNITEIRRG